MRPPSLHHNPGHAAVAGALIPLVTTGKSSRRQPAKIVDVDHWVFKGGTCLKKCYFETYRFSEDLDFSLTPSALYSADELLRQLKELARHVNEVSGIELPESSIVVEAKRNKQGQPTFRARIGYRGPLAVPTLPRVLLDLTQNEVIAAAMAGRFNAGPRSS